MQEKFEELKASVKEHPYITGMIIFLLVYVSGILSQAIYSLIHLSQIMSGEIEKSKAFSFGWRALIQWCTSIRGFLCLIIVGVLGYYAWRYLIKSRIKINTGVADDRQFDYSKKSPYGSARPLTEEDLEDILEFKPIEETNGIILGETYDGKVVSIPTTEEFEEKAKKKHWTQDDRTNNTRNRNILVVGSPGTMKSRAFIMNQILQAMKNGESIMVTDPKGELYEKTYQILTDHGYDVKMFNLISQENSDSWNPVDELSDDSTYTKIFSQTVVENADENGEEFWKNNSMNFMKAALELDSVEDMGKLYDFISGNTIEDFESEFTEATRPVAERAYKIFQQCTDTVKGQIINGLGIMIDLFQDDKIRNITNSQEIDMTKPAREKCAYFVITSDQHRTFDYLAVLFWTMAFIKLIEYIDAHKDENDNPTTLPIHMLLDEFPNVGEIPDFNRKLSTVRSRLLYVTIIIQNLPQLMNRYPNGMHEEIFSDCDFVAFLGCNDKTTAQYFSELTGIASIEVTTENNVYHREQAILNQEAEYREVKSIGQRTVMNMDEIKSIKNTDLLIFIRGTKSVFQCKKFDYSKNPLSKEIKITKIKNHIPEWRQKQIDEETEKEKAKEERRNREEKEIEMEKERMREKAKNKTAEPQITSNTSPEPEAKATPKSPKPSKPLNKSNSSNSSNGNSENVIDYGYNFDAVQMELKGMIDQTQSNSAETENSPKKPCRSSQDSPERQSKGKQGKDDKNLADESKTAEKTKQSKQATAFVNDKTKNSNNEVIDKKNEENKPIFSIFDTQQMQDDLKTSFDEEYEEDEDSEEELEYEENEESEDFISIEETEKKKANDREKSLTNLYNGVGF